MHISPPTTNAMPVSVKAWFTPSAMAVAISGGSGCPFGGATYPARSMSQPTRIGEMIAPIEATPPRAAMRIGRCRAPTENPIADADMG